MKKSLFLLFCLIIGLGCKTHAEYSHEIDLMREQRINDFLVSLEQMDIPNKQKAEQVLAFMDPQAFISFKSGNLTEQTQVNLFAQTRELLAIANNPGTSDQFRQQLAQEVVLLLSSVTHPNNGYPVSSIGNIPFSTEMNGVFVNYTDYDILVSLKGMGRSYSWKMRPHSKHMVQLPIGNYNLKVISVQYGNVMLEDTKTVDNIKNNSVIDGVIYDFGYEIYAR